jgi:hypothetical protein
VSLFLLSSTFTGIADAKGLGQCGEQTTLLRSISLDAEIGYQGYTRPVAFASTGAILSADPVTGMSERLPGDGLWLALVGRSCVNDLLGIALTGTWLVPSNRSSAEGLDIAGSQVTGRDFKPNTQWWTLDAMGTLSFTHIAKPVVGVRYDSYYTQFTDSSNTINSVYAAGDQSALSVYAVLPYVGLVVDQGPIKVGVIGLPAVIGQVNWGSTAGRSFDTPGNWARFKSNFNSSSGYFVELFASMNTSLTVSGLNVGRFGIFAKYTSIHMNANSDIDLTPGQPGSFSGPYTSGASIAIDRCVAVIAGTLTMDFTSPL